jgi:signal transduction histidine kinase
MPDYDPRTAYLIGGILYEILPFVAWIVLAGQRNRQVLLWCLGGALAGVSMLLFSAAGRWPDWRSTLLPNLFALASHYTRIQSLRLDLGQPWGRRRMLASALLIIAVHELLRGGLPSPLTRQVYMQLVHAAFLLYLAWLAWRIGRAERSRNAWMITGTYLLFAAALLFAAGDWQLTGDQPYPLAVRTSSLLVVFSAILSSVLGYYGYVGVALDRSMRRQFDAAAEREREGIRAAEERARAEESRRLGEQIALLDRQRSLGLLSASLGHELNQPLTAILTNAQLAQRGLQSERLSAAQHEQLAGKIVQSTRRAGQIIERIRASVRPIELRQQGVDLRQVAAEVAALVADEAQQRGVALALPGPGAPVQVAGDAIQLSQVLFNLMRNAVEAASALPRREVRLTVGEDEGGAWLRVQDSGPGLPDALLGDAGTQYQTSKAGGLGMGLAISRAIAQQHGGRLVLANVPAGQGGGALIELNLPGVSLD